MTRFVAASLCSSCLLVLAMVLVAPLPAAGPVGAADNQPEAALNTARKLYANRQYKEAERILRAALATHHAVASDSHEAAAFLQLLTEVYRDSGRLHDALAAALQYHHHLETLAAAHGPRLDRPRQDAEFALGQIYDLLRRHRKAEQCWQHLLSEADHPGLGRPLWEVQLRVHLAQSKRAQGRSAEARQDFAAAKSRLIGLLDRTGHDPLEEQHVPDAVDVLVECTRVAGQPDESIRCLSRLLRGLWSPEAKISTLCAMATMSAEDVAANGSSGADEKRANGEAAEVDLLQQALRIQRQSDGDEPTSGAARLYSRLAEAIYRTGRNDEEARRHWEHAVTILDSLAHRPVADREGRARQMEHLQNLQRICRQLGRWELGARVTQELLVYRRRVLLPDDPNVFRAMTALGSFYVRAARYHDAEDLLRTAADYWTARQPRADKELAGTLSALAEVVRVRGSSSESLEMFQNALASCQRTFAPDDPRLAEAHANLAVVLASRGQYREALRHYDASEDICVQAVNAPHRRAREILGNTLLNKAVLYKSQRQFAAAAKCCRQALQARQGLPNFDDRDLLPYYNVLASVNLALDQSQAGRGSAASAYLIEAETYVERSLSLCRRHRLIVQPAGALALYLSGRVHFQKRDFPTAEKRWREALSIAHTTGQMALEARLKTHLAKIELQRLAVVDAPEREPREAAACWQDVLRDKRNRLAILNQAERLLSEATRAYESIQAYPSLQFIAQVDRAQVLRETGRLHDQIADVYRKLSSTGQSVEEKDVEEKDFVADAEKRASDHGAEARSHREKAVRLLEDTAQLIEAPRAATTGGEGERAGFFAQYSLAFDLLVDWNVEDGRLDEALRYVDVSRNRTFLDQIRAAGIDLRDTLRGTRYEPLLAREQSILNDYFHQLRLVRRGLADETDAAKRQTMAESLARTRQEYAQIVSAIRDANPFYRDIVSQNSGQNIVPAIRQSFLTTGNVLLVYYLGQTSGHLFLLGPDDTSPWHIDLRYQAQGRDEAEPLTRGLADKLVRRYLLAGSSDQSHFDGFQRAVGEAVTSAKNNRWSEMTRAEAVELTNALLPEPARQWVRESGARCVLVIPDGPLHQLPLEALPLDEGPGQYVFDQFPATVYAPSLSIAAALAARPAAANSRAVSLLSVANPTYGRTASFVPVMMRQGETFGWPSDESGLTPLPGTLDECRNIVHAMDWLGRNQMTVLTAGEATERNVRAHVETHSILHLAAHGLVDDASDNLFGGIALTPPPARNVSSTDDGFLSLYEIHRLNLSHCELAVLSACRTNVGPERPLEAGSTMARVFLAAGARRVVASHWNVDDDSTTELMSEFFRELSQQLQRDSVNYAEALYQARRSVRRNPLWSSPYYWAPFVLIGSIDQ